jgi:HAD superfamily hydrolase (TIGR01549 family)
MAARVILFDLENTLWHFPVQVPADALHGRCADQIGPLFDGWGIDCDAVDIARRVLDAVEQAYREAATGPLLSPNWGEVVDGALRAAGLALDPEQIDAIWSAWQPDGVRLGRQLYPDTVSTLGWAKRAGYRLGLICNRWSSAALLRQELGLCGLAELFDAVTVSSDAGWLKPHPEMFYAALRDLGAEPDHTVMVGDSLRSDIAGAKMLGMGTVWKRNGRNHAPVDVALLPDATIDDLWELRRLPLLSGGAAEPAARWGRGHDR